MQDFASIPTRHVVLYGLDWQGAPASVAVDGDSGALKIMTDTHGYVHASNLWNIGHIFNPASGAISEMEILSPASPTQIHFAYGVNASAGGRIKFFQGITSSGGTAIVPFCLNDYTAPNPPPDVTVKQGITVSDYGTEIPIASVLSGGSGPQSIGGGDGDLVRGPEIILRPATKYVLQFTNDSIQAEYVSLHFGFYQK